MSSAAAHGASGPLAGARRIVVKIGSALLVDAGGRLRAAWLGSLAEDIRALRDRGVEVIVVTSGAIALGRRILGLARRDLRLEEKQAAAATGQIYLAHGYRDGLARVGLTTAQILLTLGDTEARRRYLNARSTIEALLRLGAVPVVNENDTVATNEIRYGDNDRLSARVAVMASADLLVLLSDVDGLYTADPAHDPDARHVPDVDEVTGEIRAMADIARTPHGTGGMVTKLEAAAIATRAGCRVVLTKGAEAHPLERLEAGAQHTDFRARANPRRARKEWIAGHLGAAGVVVIDAGAARALARGGSLLPAGVVSISGSFGRGDAVMVRDPDGHDVAKGLSAYDAADAERIRGRKTDDIEAILGYRGRDELIHRDDLVLL
jgi:glutamate 5-kinase